MGSDPILERSQLDVEQQIPTLEQLIAAVALEIVALERDIVAVLVPVAVLVIVPVLVLAQELSR